MFYIRRKKIFEKNIIIGNESTLGFVAFATESEVRKVLGDGLEKKFIKNNDSSNKFNSNDDNTDRFDKSQRSKKKGNKRQSKE